MEKNCGNCLYAIHNSNCNKGEESLFCTQGVIEILTQEEDVCDDHVFYDDDIEDEYITKYASKEFFVKLCSMFTPVELWKFIRKNVSDETFREIIKINFADDLDKQVDAILSKKLKK